MCFSAQASFSASFVLIAISILSFCKVRAARYYVMAATPLLFGMQQAAEGILWVALRHPQYAFLQQAALTIFLTFAFGVWPIWEPLSLALIESRKKRRFTLKLLTGAGSILSIFLLSHLYFYGAYAHIAQHHISYTYPMDIPAWTGALILVLYIFITTSGFFISSIPQVWIVGLALLSAYFISHYSTIMRWDPYGAFLLH